MFEGGHIVLRMMLLSARGFAPPLCGNPCEVECLIKGYPLIAGSHYQGKSLAKVNPLYHKHVYLNVSRHTLKHTMGNFQNIKHHREFQRNQNNQRGQGKKLQKA